MNVLLVLCVDKNCRYINDIVCTWIEREDAFLPSYLDQAQWSDTYTIVDLNTPPYTQTGERPIILSMVEKTHNFNTNL